MKGPGNTRQFRITINTAGMADYIYRRRRNILDSTPDTYSKLDDTLFIG